ncbi:MAG TPA: NADH-quinone oxidoreductase subunit C [Dehalococcoidia bacterium]|nr:NADH-quinone oxidoreductase subunit C [Dehalococcoidia bacterium]
MTAALKSQDIAKRIGGDLQGCIISAEGNAVMVNSEAVFRVAQYLKETPGLEFDYLANLTAVDYMDYFEVVYHLVSLGHNHSLTMKTRLYTREKPSLPSVYSLWRAADLQEREIYDLLGIQFEGHPNLKRLFLWEGFQGHPLRRDYL